MNIVLLIGDNRCGAVISKNLSIITVQGAQWVGLTEV